MKHNEGFLALVNDAKTRVQETDVAGYQNMIASGEPAILVDVREDREWNEAHAAGAIHLSKGIIERDIEKTIPDKDARIVLYCGGGYRSAIAADNLQRMGYRNVISLDGGWRAWTEAGLPVERS